MIPLQIKLIRLSLSLFDWHDLDTAKFVGLAVAIAVVWRLIAWLAMSARVGGFS
jgi:hypothetical protein